MPDSPDYHKYLPGSSRLSLQDMGELAVRNGSFVRYNRSGEVVYLDDFSHGLAGWTLFSSAGLGSIVLSVADSNMTPFVVELNNPTASGRQCVISKDISVPQIVTSGVEFCFRLVSGVDNFYIWLGYDDGLEVNAGQVLFDLVADTVQALTRTTGYVTVGTVDDKMTNGGPYNYVKLIVDLNTNKYRSVSINNIVIDISHLELMIDATNGYPTFSVMLATGGSVSASGKTHLSHVIVTANEP
jgi:hypothetical protein